MKAFIIFDGHYRGQRQQSLIWFSQISQFQPKAKGRKSKTAVVSSDDGSKLDKILGATAINGQLQFVMKWKDRDEPSVMPSEEAKIKYTMHVLEFYESYMIWESDDDSNKK